MHLQFIINLIVFVSVDIFSDNMEKDWIALPLTIFPVVPVLNTPVYMKLAGWSHMSYVPKDVSIFGGFIGNNNNGISGLLYIIPMIGVVGLYVWMIALFVFVVSSPLYSYYSFSIRSILSEDKMHNGFNLLLLLKEIRKNKLKNK